MAKAVKFKMNFGDISIRTLDDLRENFFIEDVMAHFDDGKLLRFLRQHNDTEHAEKVAALAEQKPEPETAAREIASIFGVDMDEQDVNEYAEILRLRKQRETERAARAQVKPDVQEIFEELFNKHAWPTYDEIVDLLVEHKNDLGKIKVLTHTLLDTCRSALEKDYRSLYKTLKNNKAIYPVCHMLTKDFFRLSWLDNNDIKASFRSELLREITHLRVEHPWIKRSNGAGVAYDWVDIEPAGKDYIILTVTAKAKVRSPRDIDNEVNYSWFNCGFIILDGIQYNCYDNRDKGYLYYAEV